MPADATGQERGVERGDEDGPCSVIDSIEQIGSQWRLVVLHDLQGGEKRFNELKRSTGASSRTLSRVLSDLGELDFVDRRVEADTPVATYYSLTPKGRSLCPVFDEIEAWAEEWLDGEPTEHEGTPRSGRTAPSEP
jgi:DNA-binding HxlR family transcriptional regulator